MTNRSDPGTSRSFDADHVTFVLVEPQTGGNVGSAARALKNLGFSRLVLVRPACDPRGPDALRLAVDASDLLDTSAVVSDLETALARSRMVVGATARTGKHRHPHWRLDELAGEMAGTAALGELAVVFGREDRGLTDRELDRCTHLVHLPASRAYPSFNLAQAVLLVAYELRRATLAPSGANDDGPPATQAAREAMYGHLERALSAIGFLKPDPAEVIMRRLRRLLGRARMSPDEVRLVRGIARQTLWAAGRAGLLSGTEDTTRDAEGDARGEESGWIEDN